MLNVLVTMRFDQAQLDRLRAVSPEILVTQADAETADYDKQREMDNVIVSPHVSGFLLSYDEKCSMLFAENLRRFLAGERLLNRVDGARGY